MEKTNINAPAAEELAICTCYAYGRCGKSATDIATYRSTCRYADKVGDIINTFIPAGSHPDMDKYLYAPLMKYSQNGGKRHRPLICVAAQIRFEQRRRYGLGRCIFCLAVCLEILDVLDDLGILHVRCDVCHLQRFRYNRVPAKTGHC